MPYCDKILEASEPFIDQIVKREDLKEKRFLITGATGMIGSSVLDLLLFLNERKQYGITIYAAVRNDSKIKKRYGIFAQKEYFHILPYDATKPIDFEYSVDYVIHAASNADPAAISKEPVETLMSNVFGLDQILQYAKRSSVKKTLFVSSSEIYGTNSTSKPFLEDDYGNIDLLNPRAAYPMGKRASETLCASYANEYDLNIVIARPGHIYGPTITDTDSRASAQFTRNALNHQDIIMKSAGTQLRSYCYVYDCASALLTILLNGQPTCAYNISNRHSILSISDIAKLFAKAGNVALTFENASKKEQTSYNLMSMSALDATRLENLGWHAIMDSKDGVKETLRLLKG